MHKSKICFAVTSISDNGVTRVLDLLLNNIDYEKYDVNVLLTRKEKHYRDLNSRARIFEVASELKPNIKSKFNNINEIHNILKQQNFELVISLGDYAAMYVILAFLGGIKSKLVVSERNDPNNEPDKFYYRKLRDLLFRFVDTMVCQTRDAANYYNNIAKNRVVIFNPISDSLPIFVAGTKRQKKVVNFCRIDKQKNLYLLIDSFAEFLIDFPDYQLEIYGEGPEKNSIRDYVKLKNLEKSVLLKDFCINIHDEIRDASMFVSSSNFEGMSNSMLEAMAIGLPTICTDCPVGGAAEVICNYENGILVPVNDKEAMIDSMLFIAKNQDKSELMASNASKIRERLSPKRICKQWWQLIDEELNKNNI